MGRFLNDPHLVHKLSESPLMKRAAQIVVGAYLKGKEAGENFVRSETTTNAADRIDKFKITFKEELKKELENLKKGEERKKS